MKFNRSSSLNIILEIRDRELRMLVSQSGKVQKATRRPIPPGIIRGGQVLDTQGLGQEIRSFIQNESGNIERVSIILPGFRTTCRTIEVPKMSKGLREKFIERQIDQEMPLKANELHISLITHESGSREEGTQTLLIGIPRNLIDGIKEALYLAHVKRASFTIRPFALTGLTAKVDALIFDVEPDELNIIITRQRRPFMIYSRSLDSSSTAEGVSRDEGSRDEIQRSYEYLNQYILNKVDLHNLSCYLTGASSRAAEFRANIETIFGLNPELPEYQTALPEVDKSGVYDSALGLLNLVGKSGGFLSRVPAIPGHIATQKVHGVPSILRRAVLTSLFYMPYLLGISLLVYGFYVYKGQEDILSQRREEVQRLQSRDMAQRRLLLANKNLDNDIRKMQTSLNAMVREYTEIDKKVLDYRESIQYLQDSATSIAISSISMNGTKVTLKGSSNEIQSALDYATMLSKNTRLSGIRIETITATGASSGKTPGYGFTLVAEISKTNPSLADKTLSPSLKEIIRASSYPKE